MLSASQTSPPLPGKVASIADYGAFVDVGGYDGLLHRLDMAEPPPEDPRRVVSVGDELELVVLKFDPATDRLSLGRGPARPA